MVEASPGLPEAQQRDGDFILKPIDFGPNANVLIMPDVKFDAKKFAQRGRAITQREAAGTSGTSGQPKVQETPKDQPGHGHPKLGTISQVPSAGGTGSETSSRG